MSAFAAALGPKQCGAEVLAHVAKQRLSGTLTFGLPSKARQIVLREGRPEAASESEGTAQNLRPVVVAAVRTFAVSTSGRCAFTPGPPTPGASLGIDTLGEILVAVLQVLQSTQVETLLEARGGARVEATPVFAKLAQAATALGAPAVVAPAAATILGPLVQGADAAAQRVWLAQLFLGGLRWEGWSLQLEASTAPTGAVPPASAGLLQELEAAYAKLTEQDHYAVLGVPRDASAEVIRKAYFEQAKRWHADRLVGTGLDEAAKQKAQELFHRADEANKVLTNPDERKTYDWLLERQAAGLPTDPKVVMEAESLFRRGETLVRRGQAGTAEPLLRQAVQLNKGEAEFWAYLGFAVYGVQGAAGVAEAREHLHKALKMRDKLDVAHEFLGRIAHSEGERSKASYHLGLALELNPKNAFAERELRLLNMRQEQEKKPVKDKGLLSKLLKR